MASPNQLALNRQRIDLRSSQIQIVQADQTGSRKVRRDAARELQKRMRKAPIYGRNDKGQFIILEKKRRSISFYEAIGRV